MQRSFLSDLNDAFDQVVEFQTIPDNKAVRIMLNFVFEHVKSTEEFIAVRRLINDLNGKLFSSAVYEEVNRAVKPYYIICEDEFSEKITCTYIASMMLFHNLGEGNLTLVLCEREGGGTNRAIEMNTVVMAELCERENLNLHKTGITR